MGIYRMYTGADQETHIEELDLDAHPDLESLQGVSGMKFQRSQGVMDYHPAPDRRWVVVLAGEVEIGLGDGSKHRFGKGDIRLIEDVTGHGHTTRFLGEYTAVIMPL